MTLYLFKFNNYYNRIVKKYDTIEEYLANGTLLDTFEGITNWNPNDGISTTQIINYQGDIPDYVLVVKDNEIDSRWFVIESKRTRAQQFEIELYRDVIADWYDDILNSTAFIEKATLTKDNPLFFNNENMSFNQIKTKETLLKDKTKIPWIVGYIDRTVGKKIDIAIEGFQPDYAPMEGFESYQYSKWLQYDNLNNSLKIPTNYSLQINYFNSVSSGFLGLSTKYTKYCISWDKSGQSNNYGETGVYSYQAPYVYSHGEGISGFTLSPLSQDFPTQVGLKAESKIKESDWNNVDVKAYISGLGSNSDYETLINEIGKILQIDGKFYRIALVPATTSKKNSTIPQASALGQRLATVVNKLREDYVFTNTPVPSEREPAYEISVYCNQYALTLEPIASPATYTIEIPANKEFSNTPYNIFCIPFGNIEIYGEEFITNSEMGFKLASAIIQQYSNSLYDIQLLPYCPLDKDRLFFNSEYNEWAILADADDLFLQAPTNPDAGIPSGLFWVKDPNFSFTIFADENDNSLQVPEDNIDAKVEYETSFHRICSPNFNGTFEFSAIKNNGVISFDIDCAYKPFSPYIKVSPSFGGLYGADFNDARGLILNGNFSLTQMSNAWQDYQVNNKNYQEIFDRQIENMNVNNSVQRERELITATTGTIQAGITSTIAGGMLAGPYGALAAGVGAGALSYGAGMLDYRLNEKLRNEAIDFTKDQFGYQLGNIKAMPRNLTKVSAFNPNNKIFPIIEYYTCTQKEKDALRNKIIYNGMTTMAIDTIRNYKINEISYIKAQVIRFPQVNEDFHLANTIALELNKGVYL